MPKFSRTIYLFLLVIVLLAGCHQDVSVQPTGFHQDSRTRHNVVLIVADAMRYDLPTCNGGSARTPNLNRLAAAGVRFTQAHSAAPWTMPSAVAMMTGQHASAFPSTADGSVEGRQSYSVPPAVRTLPRTLKELGYDLILSSYNPNSWLAGNFQSFRRVEPPNPDNPRHTTLPDSLIPLAELIPFRFRSPLHRRMIGMEEFLRQAPAGRPFFAVNWFDDPHGPYNPEQVYSKNLKIPVHKLARRPRYYRRQTNMHLFDHFEKASLSPVEIEYFRALYRAEVESVDERVGLILDLLEKRDLLKNTIVVFAADHGEGFGEHELFEHGRSYYEELMHVPLIITGPGLPAGRVVQNPVSLVDLMPTLQKLLGVRNPAEDLGPGFAALLTADSQANPPLYFDAASNLRGNDCRDAVLQWPFKLVTHQSDEKMDLYDLDHDPGETTNLRSTEKTRVQTMTVLLNDFRRNISALKAKYDHPRGCAADSTSAADRAKVLKQLKSLGYVN